MRHIFYQQQYAHVFSLMERFLSDTFVRQTCDNEESYHRVLDSGILVSKNIVQGKTNRAIIAGEDCLDKELLYINAIENYIVYHKLDLVSQGKRMNIRNYSLAERFFGIQNPEEYLKRNAKFHKWCL